MATRRLVPWSTPEEWKLVYSLLFSEARPDRTLGVNRVKAWMSRGKVPHAVESTCNLVAAGLQNELASASTCSPKELAYLYAMTLIRFVNGIIDGGQRGSLAASAVSIAEQLATHEKVPPLPYLQKCQTQALEWLDSNYWKIQIHALDDIAKQLELHLAEYSQRQPDHRLISAIVDELSLDTFCLLIPNLIRELVPRGRKHKKSPTKAALEGDVRKWEPLLTGCEQSCSGFARALWEALVESYFL
ncbi:Ribosomal biogenesis protein las1l, partial [Kappamyces sp. JEL0680]